MQEVPTIRRCVLNRGGHERDSYEGSTVDAADLIGQRGRCDLLLAQRVFPANYVAACCVGIREVLLIVIYYAMSTSTVQLCVVFPVPYPLERWKGQVPYRR